MKQLPLRHCSRRFVQKYICYRSKNLNFILYSRALLNENKWRASRYGIDGSLIDFGKEAEVNTRVLIYELLDFVDDVLDHLGSRHALVMYIKCWNMVQVQTGNWPYSSKQKISPKWPVTSRHNTWPGYNVVNCEYRSVL